MEEKPNSSYIGKYVCYDQADGGACWGRIKDEAVVNTMNGEKEVFILTDRYVRYTRGENMKDFRRYYPDISDILLNRPMEMKNNKFTSDGLFFEVRKIKGDSTLRKEMIDLENDIIDLGDIKDLLGQVSEDIMFKALLDNNAIRNISGESALAIGLQALTQSGAMT